MEEREIKVMENGVRKISQHYSGHCKTPSQMHKQCEIKIDKKQNTNNHVIVGVH